MRGNSSRLSSSQAITAYFNKASLRSQQETLGLIVGEILNEDVTSADWLSVQSYYDG